MSVRNCGLFINPNYPFLGASPDGLVGESGIVEIKCPFNGKNSKISPGINFPFLEFTDDGIIKLKRNHNYYYQIIGQLALSKKAKCYFIVFTFIDFFVEEIHFDEDFFKVSMLTTLKSFYESSYCPFVSRHL